LTLLLYSPCLCCPSFLWYYVVYLIWHESVQIFLIVCLYLWCHWRPNSSDWDGSGPINQFNPATRVCLSYARTYISNLYTSWSPSFVFNDLNTVISNHVNSVHVPSVSYHDVWNVRKTTSGVYAITETTSTYDTRRCGRL
jgi:hypothetical protein